LNENFYSKYTTPGFTKVGKDDRKAMEKELYLNPELPGPGTYQILSEFGAYNTEPHSFPKRN